MHQENPDVSFNNSAILEGFLDSPQFPCSPIAFIRLPRNWLVKDNLVWLYKSNLHVFVCEIIQGLNRVSVGKLKIILKQSKYILPCFNIYFQVLLWQAVCSNI